MSLARSVASSVSKTVAKPVNEAGVSGSIPGFDYIGANALGAYDIAPLKTGVTRCFRVRRSSDNTEQDCLSVAEAVTFCGAGSGFITTLYDQNGSSNLTQATTTQQPRIVNAGVADAGAVFDGTNDTGVGGNFANNDGTAAMTIAAWIRIPSYNNRAIATKQSGSGPGWRFSIDHDNLSTGTGKVGLAFWSGSQQILAESVGTVSLNTWAHVVAVYDGSKTPGGISIYINGTLQSTTTSGTTFSSSSNSTNFCLGSRNAAGDFFAGSMRDVRVYNVVKSASEIATIYASVTP